MTTCRSDPDGGTGTHRPLIFADPLVGGIEDPFSLPHPSGARSLVRTVGSRERGMPFLRQLRDFAHNCFKVFATSFPFASITCWRKRIWVALVLKAKSAWASLPSFPPKGGLEGMMSNCGGASRKRPPWWWLSSWLVWRAFQCRWAPTENKRVWERSEFGVKVKLGTPCSSRASKNTK